MTTAFRGFPEQALDFYAGLLADNSKTYWTEHKATYDECVRAPFDALLDAVAEEFGAGSLFRPYRDVRFSKDKSPYKTHAGALIGGYYYVQLDADGLLVGGGRYELDTEELARFRAAVLDDRLGGELAAIVAELRAKGHQVAGDALKRAPRGVDPDHPRIDLLRHKALYGRRELPAAPWLHTRAALKRVTDAWRDYRPLVDWLRDHAG